MKSFKLDLYPRRIWITDNRADFTKFIEVKSGDKLSEIDIEGMDACTASVQLINGNYLGELIYVDTEYMSKHKFSLSAIIGIISHEALHATFHILEDVGIEIKAEDSNEAATYLLEYIVKCCIQTLSVNI